VDDEDVDISVSYHRGGYPKSAVAEEPYAENFMAFVGGFFKAEHANADVVAQMRFSAKERQSRYLLPVSVTIVPTLETVIDGISVSFPSKPSGVRLARLTVDPNHVWVSVIGIARVAFSDFRLSKHAKKLKDVASALTTERKTS
jgi:hypothetical protein